MIAFVILETETGNVVKTGAWTKKEAVEIADTLSKTNDKEYEVMQTVRVHHAKPNSWSFEI